MNQIYGRMAQTSLLTLPLAVAVLASWGIAVMQHHSDNSRNLQLNLAHIQSLAYRLHAFEEEAVAEKRVSAQAAENKQICDRSLQQTLAKLHENGAGNDLLRQVSTTSQTFDNALQAEIPALERGDLEAAERIAEARVDPAYDAFLHSLEDANTFFNRLAMSKNRQADMGTTFLLVTASLFLTGFLARFKKSQLTRALQEATQQRESYIAALLANVSDVIMVLDENGAIRFVSSAVEEVLGYTSADLQHSLLFTLVHEDNQIAVKNVLNNCTQKKTLVTEEMRFCDVQGVWHYMELTTLDLRGNAEIAGILVTLRDVSERKGLEEHISFQAYHDTLTELPNRAFLNERLKTALLRAKHRDNSVGVIFVDLDNFKMINDSLGHEAGDELLKTIAGRLLACTRAGDTVARLGGDEFVLLLEEVESDQDAVTIAERILEQLKVPITLQGREVFAGASIGVACTPEAAQDPDGLMRDADTAMYQAKTGGKASYVLFNTSMNAQAEERLELEHDLRYALERKELRLHYQPILSLGSQHVSEVEALIRWEHTRHGLIAPIKFIPFAEKSGLIVAIGYWVLEQACLQGKVWLQENPANPVVVGVNVSAKQLQQPDFVDRVEATLETTGLPPAQLKLEITESMMITDLEATVAKMHLLKALGIRLAIDDFGTGYSSMSYLSQLPVDTLKVDRSFVQHLGEGTEHQSVILAIINLAKSLNMTVTSEGIETIEQLSQLEEMGSDQGQGYLFARPMPQAALSALLHTQTQESAEEKRKAA